MRRAGGQTSQRSQPLGLPQPLLTLLLLGDVAHDAEHSNGLTVLVLLAEATVADESPASVGVPKPVFDLEGPSSLHRLAKLALGPRPVIAVHPLERRVDGVADL